MVSPLRLVVSPLFEVFDQPPGTSCGSLRGPGLSPFPSGSSGSGVFGQLHLVALPQEARGHSFFHLKCSRSGASSALRVPFHLASPPVHSRPSECSGGFSQPPISGPGVRVDFMYGSLSRSSSLACQHRPFCDVPQSSASGVLLADDRSAVSWQGCHASVVGWPSGLCLSTFWPHSKGSGEGFGVLGGWS